MWVKKYKQKSVITPIEAARLQRDLQILLNRTSYLEARVLTLEHPFKYKIGDVVKGVNIIKGIVIDRRSGSWYGVTYANIYKILKESDKSVIEVSQDGLSPYSNK